ncbi:MAG: Dabb family protein [Rhizobiales bacterium]|nr:Dabb family protein [Hyphomicrobiales bacterium]
MISHCVFVRYRPDATDAMRDDIYRGLQALKPRIPGLTNIVIGANSSPEGLDKGFSEGFIVTFRDARARDQYLADTEHAKVGALLVAAAAGGLDGILVYDLES